jgi:3-hydroxy-9,10-secoandrosta-1,3,5(10)-triene-9,17-dione monooxygenase reductase component
VEREDDPKVRLRFEDPFATPIEDRRPDRQLRGRLVAPVAVLTAGSGEHRAGLTISSLLVAEGDPPHVLALVDPLSELRELAGETGAFLVHVLNEGEHRLAASFAGQYPADPFEGLELSLCAHGPRLAGDRTVVACRFIRAEPAGFQELVVGEIEQIEFASRRTAALARYRGQYRSVREE